MAGNNICVPIKLDAFCLSPLNCEVLPDGNQSRICPITQPNYTYLRYDNSLIQHDILDRVDLHVCAPANLNPRLTDLGSGEPFKNRQGVYLHWSLPRVYR